MNKAPLSPELVFRAANEMVPSQAALLIAQASILERSLVLELIQVAVAILSLFRITSQQIVV